MKSLLLSSYYLILWLRQVVFILVMFITTLVMLFIMLIFGFIRLPLAFRAFVPHCWAKINRILFLCLLQQRIIIINKHNLHKGGCVYISKHQSAWETLIFHGLFKKVSTVLKKELLTLPLFGRCLIIAENIPIDRKSGIKAYKQVIIEGKDRLKKNMQIVIYPEGTRVGVGQYPEFHKTAIMLAKSSEACVIPVAHNSGTCWPKKFGWFNIIKPGIITVIIGDKIDTKNMSVSELNDICYRWISEQTKSIKG